MRTFPSRRNFATGLLTLIVAVLFACSETLCTIIYVDDDNTTGPWDGTADNPYQYVQEGVDHSGSGDTVFVFAGVYYENITVNRQIHLVGEKRDSTIIDGSETGCVVVVSAGGVTISGFTIQNSGGWRAGLYLRGPSSDNNVVSGNTILSNSSDGYGGIRLESSSHNTISENIISDNDRYGIYLDWGSSDNVICENTVTGNSWNGVRLDGSRYNNTISGNTILNNGVGIDMLDGCSSNNISGNVLTGNNFGVALEGCCGNVISDNTITYNAVRGIIAEGLARSNSIFGNTIVGNPEGVDLRYSRDNAVYQNIITHNYYSGITANGEFDTIYANTIANGMYGISVWGSDNIIFGNTITNCGDGFYLFFSARNLITNNLITENGTGVRSFLDSYDTIASNTIANSTYYGVYFTNRSSNNVFYHNNFINNPQNAWDEGVNTWDDGYPSGGNYWDDYTGVDADGDGIGETPYDIPGGNNQDRYPLTYVRGDVNGDRHINTADVVFLINYVLKDGPAPVPLTAGDVDLDGLLDIQDVYYLIAYLFGGGPPPRG